VDVREERFRAKVERRGDHEVWIGAVDASGTGLVRIDGKLRTVQRAAWEFANGALGKDDRVLSCPAERACVRVAHLRVVRPSAPIGSRARRTRGTGSMREVRAGVWRLTVSDGPGPDGQPVRRNITVRGNRREAAARLEDLAETTHGPTRLGDMRVRDLIDRHLAWLDDGTDTKRLASLRHLAAAQTEAAIGGEYAALLDARAVRRALASAYRNGASSAEVRELLNITRAAYQWAQHRRWTSRDPTLDINVRDITN
jgi:hypothetical protein